MDEFRLLFSDKNYIYNFDKILEFFINKNILFKEYTAFKEKTIIFYVDNKDYCTFSSFRGQIIYSYINMDIPIKIKILKEIFYEK